MCVGRVVDETVVVENEVRYVAFFFFNDTATTEIYTLSLHDALPISFSNSWKCFCYQINHVLWYSSHPEVKGPEFESMRSEEHTSELQSRQYLVCRLLLEKKKLNLKTPLSSLDHTSKHVASSSPQPCT